MADQAIPQGKQRRLSEPATPPITALDRDRQESTKRAFESGAYQKDEQGNMQFKGVK